MSISNEQLEHVKAFQEACYKGELDRARELVEKHNVDPNYVIEGKHWTPLYHACIGGHMDIITYLVDELHCDTSIGDEYGETPLHFAAQREKMELVKYLGEKTDLNVRNQFGATPLHSAASSGNIEIVKYFVLEKKCDADVLTKYDETPLHKACESGHLDLVKVLVEDLNCATDIKGGILHKLTPAELALNSDNLYKRESCLDVALYLLERIGYGELAPKVLCGACRWGRLELVKELIERFKLNPVDAKDNRYKSAVDRTFKYLLEDKTSMGVALYFLELGSASESHKQYLLGAVCYYGLLDTLKSLVNDHKIDPNIKLAVIEDKTPVHIAIASVAENNIEMVKYLVDELKLSPCAIGKQGKSPLHLAAWGGRKELVEYLAVEKKCPADVEDSRGYTALAYAEKDGHTEIVDILKALPKSEPVEEEKLKAKEETGNSETKEPQLTKDQINDINFAAREDELDELKKLKEKCQADLKNVKDSSGWTPLIWASWGGAIKVLKYLVEEEGISTDQEDKYGQSAWAYAFPQINRSEGNFDVVYYYHCHGYTSHGDKDELLCGACKHGRVDMVKSLIEKHNLKPNYVRDFKGYSPMYHALDNILEDKKNLEIAMVLVEAGYNDEKDLVTLLSAACYLGEFDLAETLIEKYGVNPSAGGKKMGNITPFHIVCAKGDLALVKKFVEKYKVNIEVADDQGATPFHSACSEGHMEIVTYFLNDLKYKMADELRNTVVHFACAGKKLDLVKFLVEEEKFDGCALNEKDQTPLHVAAKVGSLEIVKYLVLELKCRLNQIDKNGSYADHKAYQKHDEVHKFLYDRRVNPEKYR